jgi:hypothetical protein
MLVTKADDWDYEEEYRLISIRTPNKNAGYFQADGDFFRLPPGTLKSVIAGCQADYDAITKVVKDYAPGLPIKRAVRLPNHYKLKIE